MVKSPLDEQIRDMDGVCWDCVHPVDEHPQGGICLHRLETASGVDPDWRCDCPILTHAPLDLREVVRIDLAGHPNAQLVFTLADKPLEEDDHVFLRVGMVDWKARVAGSLCRAQVVPPGQTIYTVNLIQAWELVEAGTPLGTPIEVVAGY